MGISSRFSLPTEFFSANVPSSDVVVDPTGQYIYVCNSGFSIEKLSISGQALAMWRVFYSDGTSPWRLSVDCAGDVYVATDYLNEGVRVLDVNGMLSILATNGTGNGQFNYSAGIATDAAGDVYVCDENTGRVESLICAQAYLLTSNQGTSTLTNTPTNTFTKTLTATITPTFTITPTPVTGGTTARVYLNDKLCG